MSDDKCLSDAEIRHIRKLVDERGVNLVAGDLKISSATLKAVLGKSSVRRATIVAVRAGIATVPASK